LEDAGLEIRNNKLPFAVIWMQTRIREFISFHFTERCRIIYYQQCWMISRVNTRCRHLPILAWCQLLKFRCVLYHGQPWRRLGLHLLGTLSTGPMFYILLLL